jgi:hypothetical protein
VHMQPLGESTHLWSLNVPEFGPDKSALYHHVSSNLLNSGLNWDSQHSCAVLQGIFQAIPATPSMQWIWRPSEVHDYLVKGTKKSSA